MLITGKAPFSGNDDREIIKKVLKGQFSTDTLDFEGISDDCISLIR